VNNHARRSAPDSPRNVARERHASANVSAVNSTASSASHVRRAKNIKTASASERYSAMNWSGSMHDLGCALAQNCDQKARRCCSESS